MKKIQTLFLFMVFNSLFSAEGTWGFPGVFLNFAPSARSLSLGKAYTGLSDDAAALYYNPGALVQLNPQELQFTGAPLAFGGQYGWFGYVRPTKKYGTFGAQVVYAGSGKIEATNYQGQRLDYAFQEANIGVNLSYGKELAYFLDAGFSYKLIYHKISHWQGVGQGLDLGFLLFPYSQLTAGFSFLNVLAPSIKLIQQRETYPLTVRFGGALKLFENALIILLDGNYIRDNKSKKYTYDFGSGIEYTPLYFLSLRAGIDRYRFSFGFGTFLKLPGKKIGVDVGGVYNYESGGEFPILFLATLWLKFSGFRLEVQPQVRVFSPRSRENNILDVDLFVNTRKKIEKWQFVVKDDKGEVVRIFKDFGNPPRELIWDGRDDLGHLVRDGSYSYEFRVVEKQGAILVDQGYLSNVRTIGPVGEILFKEKYPVEEKKPLPGIEETKPEEKEEIKIEEESKPEEQTPPKEE